MPHNKYLIDGVFIDAVLKITILGGTLNVKSFIIDGEDPEG